MEAEYVFDRTYAIVLCGDIGTVYIEHFSWYRRNRKYERTEVVLKRPAEPIAGVGP